MQFCVSGEMNVARVARNKTWTEPFDELRTGCRCHGGKIQLLLAYPTCAASLTESAALLGRGVVDVVIPQGFRIADVAEVELGAVPAVHGPHGFVESPG